MLYLLIASFMWGSSFIATKMAYDMLNPALVVLGRLIMAAVFTLPIMWSYFKNHNVISKVQLIKIIGLGLLTYPVTYLLHV